MFDLPRKHRILDDDDAAEAMASLLVGAIVESRPPIVVIDGKAAIGGVSTSALLVLIMAVVDVVITAGDFPIAKVKEIADGMVEVATARTTEEVSAAKKIVQTALEAAATMLAPRSDAVEAAKA